MSSNRRKHILDPKTVERIMLAVTEVNGCAACSYAHTQMALREGLSNDEIVSLLGGDTASVPPQEAKAILFAQHFAEQKGLPDKETYTEFAKAYPAEQREVMIATMQIILYGNAYGIPFSAFASRLRGRAYHNSSVWYEMSMLVWGVISLPFALLHVLIGGIARAPVIRFKKEG